MNFDSEQSSRRNVPPVSKGELNSWRRGFTPQAEIWNGRMAIVGLILFLGSLLLYNSIFQN